MIVHFLHAHTPYLWLLVGVARTKIEWVEQGWLFLGQGYCKSRNCNRIIRWAIGPQDCHKTKFSITSDGLLEPHTCLGLIHTGNVELSTEIHRGAVETPSPSAGDD